MKTIYVVTHGKKFSGADPAMTATGDEEIRSLRKYIPETPSAIICGTGRRHIHVAIALGFPEPDEFSCFAGDPDSGEMIGLEFKVFLPGGEVIPLSKHLSLRDMAPAMLPFLQRLPDDAVLCSGRPFGFILKYAGLYDGDFQSAAVYKITASEDSIEVEKMFAIGDTDPTLK